MDILEKMKVFLKSTIDKDMDVTNLCNKCITTNENFSMGYKEDSIYKTKDEQSKLIEYLSENGYYIFHSGNDWNSFTFNYYCDCCNNMYDLTSWFPIDDEYEDESEEKTTEMYFNQMGLDEKNRFKDELIYFKSLIELGKHYISFLEDREIYIYDRLEYNLGVDPLYKNLSDDSFDKQTYSHFIINEKFKSNFLKNNSVHWESSGLCRLKINELNLKWNVGSASSGLSGYVKNEYFYVDKYDVLKIEFYDIVNDLWVDVTDKENIDRIMATNKIWVEENKESLYKLEREKTLRYIVDDLLDSNK